MRTELSWSITQHVVVISYRRFGTTYRAPSSRVKIQDHYALRNNPEECRSQMSTVSVSWFRHLGGTDSHTWTLFFLLCERNCLLSTLGENSGRTPYNTLHVAYTILCLLTMWRKLCRVDYLLLQAGWAISTWCAACFCRQYFYQIVVNSWPDFQQHCRKTRHEATSCVNVDTGFWSDYFFCSRFERLSLYRNPHHMVEWGITFAAIISEETVASSCRKFYFMSGIFVNRER